MDVATESAHAAIGPARDALNVCKVRRRALLVTLAEADKKVDEQSRVVAEMRGASTRALFALHNVDAVDSLDLQVQRQSALDDANKVEKAATELHTAAVKAHAAVLAELNATNQAVRKAASNLKRLLVRRQFEYFMQQKQMFRYMRTDMLGAYLADPDALTGEEWMEVDQLIDFTAEQMNIGMPLIGTSIYNPKAFGGDPKPARQLVDDAAKKYQQHLEEIERTPPDPGEATSDAA